jgi:hypothetical protein
LERGTAQLVTDFPHLQTPGYYCKAAAGLFIYPTRDPTDP